MKNEKDLDNVIFNLLDSYYNCLKNHVENDVINDLNFHIRINMDNLSFYKCKNETLRSIFKYCCNYQNSQYVNDGRVHKAYEHKIETLLGEYKDDRS